MTIIRQKVITIIVLMILIVEIMMVMIEKTGRLLSALAGFCFYNIFSYYCNYYCVTYGFEF